MLLIDFFAIYVTLFNAPLGIKSVEFEKYVLQATGTLDFLYDFGIIFIHIVVGVWYGHDYLLVTTAIFGTFVLASDFLSLYYATFDYEKDHFGDYVVKEKVGEI